MLESAYSAFGMLFGCPCALNLIPFRLIYLVGGVLMGLTFGLIPGLTGMIGLALLLPFTFYMDAPAAFALMMGLLSITATSDTIPAVLFGVPGSGAAQATILDGHVMAKRGEAGRAFGAAFTASMIGGVFGGVILGLSVPILRPLVLAFGSPEIFMLGLLGIAMVGVLSGNAPLKGLVSGGIGLLIGMIGMDPQTGHLRWVYGETYLYDGVSLILIALGLFAIPELIGIAAKGTRIADQVPVSGGGTLDGVRDALRNWFLILRCSALGIWVGVIPGISSSVASWIGYGHAMQTERGARESFGKGDVRGVIAPESANNATEGGDLIPTLAFGVPGSASMAMLLGAFLIYGMKPGPEMITVHLDMTFLLMWSIILANILGTALCLLLSKQMVRLTRVRSELLVAPILVVVFLAAFEANREIADLIALLVLAALGWGMKQLDWPRAPLLLGVVLSSVIENYMFISVRAMGADFLTRPIVMTIAALIVGTLAYGFFVPRNRGIRAAEDTA
jgi:TctA family transporter